ncbi:MAG: SUMF1/EgtB/PvdO family nonheme iron enzyme [Flavobacteriales bacterium]|nr:SUMF1/EgtB/PvdO family nonheme iron enzyme [Flavobacteriales bacterium]
MPTQLPSSYLAALVGLALLAATPSVRANNITTSAGSLVDDNGSQVYVQFDVTWENSWRTSFEPTNWDAAWIFVKYRTADGLWHHASLNRTGHTAPIGSTIATGLVDPASPYNVFTNPGVGVFLHAGAEGSGTFAVNGVQLQWEHNADVTGLWEVEEVRVFAIEMVYVPQGAFAAGTGGTETNAFTLTTIDTGTATAAPGGTGGLGGEAGGYPTGQTAPDNASWPNGYNAFYCMKYEVSQQGYVDFLNTLTYTQQATRTATAPSSAEGTGVLNLDNLLRNGIDIQTPGVDPTTPAQYACNLNGNATYDEPMDGKDIACNYLSWGDLTAYLDWSGLRPMTELEFEKACRGTVPPLGEEFPWGTADIVGSAYTLANDGASNEGIATNYSTTMGNAVYNPNDEDIGGPVRVGIFAANVSNSGRVTAGASYYGIMELGGNVQERTVTIGNANGRAFTGTHGNGALAASGDPDGATWPAPTTADGAGFRGGHWNSGTPDLQTSDRFEAAVTSSGSTSLWGGRGARQAP